MKLFKVFLGLLFIGTCNQLIGIAIGFNYPPNPNADITIVWELRGWPNRKTNPIMVKSNQQVEVPADAFKSYISVDGKTAQCHIPGVADLIKSIDLLPGSDISICEEKLISQAPTPKYTFIYEKDLNTTINVTWSNQPKDVFAYNTIQSNQPIQPPEYARSYYSLSVERNPICSNMVNNGNYEVRIKQQKTLFCKIRWKIYDGNR